ncbi:MAG: hypothetical protein WBZ36_12220 [Candidatus Nitrosopolaris sp.]
MSQEVGKLEQYGIEELQGRTKNQPDPETQQEPTLQEMDEINDDMDVVKEEEIEPYQKPPIESWNPIISLEEFFTDDLSLSSHDFEESPCFPIIDIEIGEPSTDRKYFCKLHRDFKSSFIETIECHCRSVAPEEHKAAIEKEGKL